MENQVYEIKLEEVKNISNDDLKVIFSEICQWNTRGVLPENGLMLTVHNKIIEKILESKVMNRYYNLKELEQQLLFEIGNRFCNMS